MRVDKATKQTWKDAISFIELGHFLIQTNNSKYDIASLTQLLAHAKWHHGSILCKQIPTNNCSLK